MQALSAVVNTADNVKPTKGSRSSQADSIAMIVPGEKGSFTEILEQLFTMFPTATSANIDGQSGDKQAITNVLDQKAEVGSDKSNNQGNEATLSGIMLAMPVIYIGQPDKSSEKGTIAEAVITKSEGKPTINKYFAATGDIPFAMAEMQPVTGILETIASDSNIQPGFGQTDQTSKTLATTQPQDFKSAVMGSYSTEQPGFAEVIGQTGKERSTIAAEIRPGNEPAATTSFSTDQFIEVSTSQKGKDSRIMTVAEVPVTENAKEAVNSETVRSELKKAVRQIGQESKIIVNTEQPAIESPHEVTTSNGKVKPVIEETARSTDKENKNLASIGQQDSGSAESAVTDITTKSVTKRSVKANGDEVKISNTAGKKTDIPARDTAGETNLQPSLNNIQVATERPKSDKKVMSKSQIDFIASNLAGKINSGTSSLEINLQPESLGKIKLMFQMDDGSLSVRIIAHSEETRNLLDASLQNIKESLNQQGIKVDDMSLDLANQQKHGNQSGSGYREASRTMGMIAEKKESYNNTEIWEQNSSQYSRLNILA